MMDSQQSIVFDKRYINLIDRQNKIAYDKLASEYNDDSHETTRLLEDASLTGLKYLLLRYIVANPTSLPSQSTLKLRKSKPPIKILDVGSGPGSSISKLITILNSSKLKKNTIELSVLDLSSKMLSELKKSLKSKIKIHNFFLGSILKNNISSQTFDIIICSLADPYISYSALVNIKKLLKPGGFCLVSSPSLPWAIKERSKRLQVSPNMTKFKLKSGSYVESFSFVYSKEDFKVISYSAHLDTIASITTESDISINKKLKRKKVSVDSYLLCRRTDLQEFIHFTKYYKSAREWSQFHQPKDLLLGMVEEIGEIRNIIKWVQKPREVYNLIDKNIVEVKDFFGDMLWYLSSFADYAKFKDVSQILSSHINEKLLRYPISKTKNSTSNAFTGGYDAKYRK